MTLAQYAMLLVIGWQAYNLARDSGMNIAEGSGTLALIGLLQFLPLFVLTPFSGLAADRFDRRTVGLMTILLQLVCAGILAWFSWAD
ncbi:MAG: MFS transporter, partial [Pseudomonadota bacterium]